MVEKALSEAWKRAVPGRSQCTWAAVRRTTGPGYCLDLASSISSQSGAASWTTRKTG